MISFFSLLGLFFAAVGFLGAHFRFLSPIAGFYGALLGLVLMALFMVPQFINLFRKYREKSWGGLVLGLASAAALGFLLKQGMESPLRDVTTNPVSPPLFQAVSTKFPVDDPALLEPTFLVNKDYNPNDAKAQAKFLPGLGAVALKLPPDQAFAKVDALVRTQYPHWKIVKTVPNHLEAEVESYGFHFIDDIVIETRPGAAGTAVEMRSRRRYGHTDFGDNVRRILDFQARLK